MYVALYCQDVPLCFVQHIVDKTFSCYSLAFERFLWRLYRFGRIIYSLFRHAVNDLLSHLWFLVRHYLHSWQRLWHEGGIKGCNTLYCLPTIQETVYHIEQGTETYIGIILPNLMCTDMRGIIAKLPYDINIFLKIPVIIYESIHFRAFEHIVKRFVLIKGNGSHRQMVLHQPFQCLPGIRGRLFRKRVLKYFCLIAVIMQFAESRNMLSQQLDKVEILHSAVTSSYYNIGFYYLHVLPDNHILSVGANSVLLLWL